MFQDHKVAYLRENIRIKQAQRLSFLRQSVAYIHWMSARNVAAASMTTEYDVTPLVEYTKEKESEIQERKDEFTDKWLFRRAIHKNFSAFFLKAMAHALYHTPCMNAFLDYGPLRTSGTLYRAEDVNLGFTVHTKWGVIRPVLRNPHLKTLDQVAAESRDLTRRARRTDPEELYRKAADYYLWPAIKQLDPRVLLPAWIMIREKLFHRYRPDPEYAKIPLEQKLKPEEILGATASVANIGMMVKGHQTMTCIPVPEVMMFGIGDLHVAPRVYNGEIVPRYVITVCGTMDHRAFDAGEAFPFASKLGHYIKNPQLIYEYKPGDAV